MDLPKAPFVLDELRAMETAVRDQFGAEILGVFGSVARGEARSDSDIDIAYRIFDMDRFTSVPWCLGAFYNVFHDRFDRPLSLVDWDNADAFFKRRAGRDLIRLNG